MKPLDKLNPIQSRFDIGGKHIRFNKMSIHTFKFLKLLWLQTPTLRENKIKRFKLFRESKNQKR